MTEAERDVLTERRGKALWITINREARAMRSILASSLAFMMQ
jgi:hypothetical protein